MKRFWSSSDPKILLAMLLTAFAIFIADSQTPLGVAVWVFYIGPGLLSVFLWNPLLPLTASALGTLLIVIGYFISPVDSSMSFGPFLLLNRLFGIVIIWITGFIARSFVLSKIELQEQQWLSVGQTKLSEKLRGALKLEILGQNILVALADYLHAHVGSVYVSTESGTLQLCAAYAHKGFEKNPDITGLPTGFQIGESLVGQTFSENRLVHIQNVPTGYLPINSSLGSVEPRHLILFPSTVDGAPNAVIELGFLEPPTELTLRFLQIIAEQIGISLRSAKRQKRLAQLLEETQKQTEELQTQQEELRVSNEELEEQTRALKEAQSHLENQRAELEQTNEQLEAQAKALANQKDELKERNDELQKTQERVQAASRYKSEFLANMSHELRTPLNSSLILSRLLAENAQGNLTEEQVEFAKTISAAGNDLLDLINDVLDLSKVEAGKLELHPEKRPIKKLIENMENIFRPVALQKHLDFEVVQQTDVPETLETDHQRLEQILKNLLANAFKFTAKGHVKLELSYSAAEKNISFSVADTGIGIAKNQQEIIFEAFMQADGTTNRHYGGTGLGLSISKDLTKLLGGTIHLESELGEGSRFTIILPETFHKPIAYQKPAAPFTPKPKTSFKSATQPKAHSPTLADDRKQLSDTHKKILVIEDDEKFAKIVYDLAKEMGFKCLIALNAEDGFNTALEFLPDAIVLDMNLPDGSGLGVLARLKESPPTRHIPVHIVSVEDYTQKALQLGAIGYKLKPIKREDLKEAFKKLEQKFSQKVKKLLIVEDDDAQRNAIQKLIADSDVEITAVQNAKEALRVLKDTIFDCMIVDLSLPDMSGYELFETMTADSISSFPPVIVYTGRSLSRDEEDRLRKYSQSIILKGARSPERLLSEVSLFLHRVESKMPREKQRTLHDARSREKIFEARKVLVVDDDARNIFALTSVLESKGAKIEVARNGKEALQKLNEVTDIDLVLMDIMMPEMDGFTAMREIRKQTKFTRLPIIALTAKAMRDDQEKCLEAGANDYLAKPVDLEKLLSLVRVWISQAGRV